MSTMKVCQAISSPKFLGGTHAIQYVEPVDRDAHAGIVQVAAASLDSTPVCVQRTQAQDGSFPAWRVFAGTGRCGIWIPDLAALLAPCRLVRLAGPDRPQAAAYGGRHERP
jgi:hypothetical protein